MRTNIELDDALMAAAKEATGLPPKKAIVEQSLRDLVLRYRQKKAIESLTGLGWEGDLQALRRDRPDDDEI
jgi:Arc/MetJ family transcription regulator